MTSDRRLSESVSAKASPDKATTPAPGGERSLSAGSGPSATDVAILKRAALTYDEWMGVDLAMRALERMVDALEARR